MLKTPVSPGPCFFFLVDLFWFVGLFLADACCEAAAAATR